MNVLEGELARAEAAGNGHESPDGPSAKPRLWARLVAVSVQLEVVADDGTTLHPVGVQPIRVAAADWPKFDLAQKVAEVEREINGPNA